MNKKRSEREHAKRRALERYDLTFTKTIRYALLDKIKRSDGTFLFRQSRRISIWEVDHENKKYRIVYDKDRKEIVTFLPPEEPLEQNTHHDIAVIGEQQLRDQQTRLTS